MALSVAAATESETLTSRPNALKGAQALTVGEVVARLKTLIEQRFPSPLWIEGELSNCSFPSSGHIYFDLVDERATDRRGQRLVLPCAFFRNANQSLKFKLTNGLKVLCLGQITTYEARGQYQLQVLRVEPKGIGALQLAFEQLKKRLQAEGLFDPARKRPIPRMIHRVGIVTSPSGEAIHDMVSQLRDWFHVIVVPAKVQGDGSAEEIAEAVGLANRLALADVLIVGRGGGSIEDLWAFNEEIVARALARSRIPVISAVGHQEDWTIADFVADVRASTPTDAAKLLVHNREAALTEAHETIQRLCDTMQAFLEEQTQRVERLHGQLRLLHPNHQLEQYLTRTRELQLHLSRSMRHDLQQREHALRGLAGRLQALSPLAVLSRGYSITRRLSDGRIVTDAEALRLNEEIETLLARGRVVSTVTR